MLAPGIVLFGFVMLMFSSAMILSRDREKCPLFAAADGPAPIEGLRSGLFPAYSLMAIIQGFVLFAIGGLFGLEIDGSVGLVFVVLFVMAIGYIGLGMILGSLLALGPLSGAYSVILLLTIFGGAWMDLEAIGGVFRTVGNALPFAHALECGPGSHD